MESSKISLQQNAVLLFLDSLLNEFGAQNLDVKPILYYALGPLVSPFLLFPRLGSGQQQARGQKQRHPAGLQLFPPSGLGGSIHRRAKRHQRRPQEKSHRSSPKRTLRPFSRRELPVSRGKARSFGRAREGRESRGESERFGGGVRRFERGEMNERLVTCSCSR